MKVRKVKQIHYWNSGLKFTFCLFAVYKIITFYGLGMMSRIPVTLSVFLTLLVPWLIKKVLHYNLKDSTELVYLLFLFLALILGSVVNLYSTIWWWDLFVHFLSGILTSYVALLILEEFHLIKKSKMFTLLFMFTFSLAVASVWEYFEFTIDKVLGSDTQWVKDTGVDDTMTDMLIATLGSGIYVFGYGTIKKK